MTKPNKGDPVSIKQFLNYGFQTTLLQETQISHGTYARIAHNMTAHVMDFHHQILSKWKKCNDFIGFANEIIYDIETFKLEWCKVKHLPKASWIGENKMAFVRLSSFLYGMFS